MLGQQDIHMQKKKLDPYLIFIYKNYSEWISDLIKRIKTIKLIEENIGVNLHYL